MIVWQDKHVTLFKSALYETLSSVIVTDDCLIVVDPCWLPHEIEEIRRYVAKIRGKRPLYLLFTHSDFDHIIGYKAFPEAAVIASEAFHRKAAADKEKIVEEIKTFDDQYYLMRNYEILYPNVHIPIAGENEVLEIGRTKLRFFQAPGHTDDGLFTLIEPLGIFVAGDYFSDIEFPFIYDDSRRYEATLRKLDDILTYCQLRLLIPGHGNATNDLLEIKKRQKEALIYIQQTRKFVMDNDASGLERLIEGCLFPRNLRKCHEKNIRQIKKELDSVEKERN